MDVGIPQTMKAAAIDRYGGPEVFHTALAAGSRAERRRGADPARRGGDRRLGSLGPRGEPRTIGERRFPQVIGNDGAGTVVAVGRRRDAVPRRRSGLRLHDGGRLLRRVRGGDRGQRRARSRAGSSPSEAGALGADGITALRGLEDQLQPRARRDADDLRRQRRHRAHGGAARQAHGRARCSRSPRARTASSWCGGWAPTSRWTGGSDDVAAGGARVRARGARRRAGAGRRRGAGRGARAR